MRCRAAQREARSSRRGTAKLGPLAGTSLLGVSKCSRSRIPRGAVRAPLLPGLLGHSLALGWLKEDSLSWES